MGRCLDEKSINRRDPDGNTPLHLASLADVEPAIIRILMRMRANPELRNIDKQTALHVAAAHASRGDTITSMLNYVSEVDAWIRGDRDWLMRTTGTTALHLASQQRNAADVVAALLLGGADIDARAHDRYCFHAHRSPVGILDQPSYFSAIGGKPTFAADAPCHSSIFLS